MGITDALVIISTVIFLLLMWGIVGYRHLSHLRREIFGQWEVLDEGLRKRHDLLPNLIETVRVHASKVELFQKLIDERSLAMREYRPGAKKIEYEHDLSKRIDEVFSLGSENGELSKDTGFLELHKEIDDLEQNIEEKSKRYNKMVREYNSHRKYAILKPLAGVFGFKVANIFEVEI